MTYRFGALRRAAHMPVLLVMAFSLAGCFDIQFDVTLHSDGSGNIRTTAEMSKELSGLMQMDKDKKGKTKDRDLSILAKNNKNVAVETSVKGGRVTAIERKAFKSLSDLSLGETRLEVVDLGRSFPGVDRTRVRWLSSADFKGMSKDNPEARDPMILNFFKGYAYALTLRLPCNVTNANEMKLGTVTVKPEIAKRWNNESTVKWTVPMDALLAAESGPPVFEVECWSWAGIKPGKTK